MVEIKQNKPSHNINKCRGGLAVGMIIVEVGRSAVEGVKRRHGEKKWGMWWDETVGHTASLLKRQEGEFKGEQRLLLFLLQSDREDLY